LLKLENIIEPTIDSLNTSIYLDLETDLKRPLQLYNLKTILDLVKDKITMDLNPLTTNKVMFIPELMDKSNLWKPKFLKDVISEEPLIIKFVILLLNVLFALKFNNVDGVKLPENVCPTVPNKIALILSLLIEKNAKPIKLRWDVSHCQVLPLMPLISSIPNLITSLNNISLLTTSDWKKKEKKFSLLTIIKEL